MHNKLAVTLSILAAAFTIVLGGIGASAQPREPSREPVLRVETGGHGAQIWQIGVDRAGTYAVSVSDDKTARVWELATGKLVRTFRVPIGEGNEGKVWAAGISPDGTVVAVGGWTGYEWETLHSIYLFDRESGRLIKRISGLPNVVKSLVFSSDGLSLAAVFGSDGVRKWRTSDWTEVGRDTTCVESSYGVSLATDGRVVMSCYDGTIRLFDSTVHQTAKVTAPGGKRPYDVAFSPDGELIAVGYLDSARVDVLSAKDLEFMYSADTKGFSNCNFGTVAWSAGGTMLYAGGTCKNAVPGDRIIRRWSDSGQGKFVDAPASDNTVGDIVPLPTGGVVYTGGTTWDILDTQHRKTRVGPPGQIADYRDLDVLTDLRGTSIRFGSYASAQSIFQLPDRALKPDAPAAAAMQPPRKDVEGFSITGWKNTTDPRLNGTILNLDQYEIARSVAIAPDDERLLLGSDWNLRVYNRSGKKFWATATPGSAWSVNISGDGRLAIAAFGDGTIRWYRMIDGKELLAFFPHNDGKRWILWTPSGYYDASPGAEDLIGWHVNNGLNRAADFFPVGQFRDTFHRPDVIDRILTTLDEQTALKQANDDAGRKADQTSILQQLPPVVEIISPADGSSIRGSEVTIRYRLRSPSGQPVTGLKGLVNGRPSVTERGLNIGIARDASDVREMKVSLVEAETAVSIIAENQYTSSVPATVRVRAEIAGTSTGGAPGAPAGISLKPTLYVLAVGVSKYSDESLTLGYPSKDARDFAAAMTRQKGGLYADVVTKVLVDENATRDNVADGLQWITEQTTARDVAMVFIAGHGVMDQGDYFFLPYNADVKRLIRTTVAYSDIKRTVERLAGKTLFFVDTCHSGRAAGGPVTRDVADMNGLVNDLIRAENGAVVFAASTGRQSSLEDVTWGNGAFTKALVEGITGGGALFGDTAITINTLDAYIARRVKELTGGRQTPTTQKPNTIQDFPIAVKK